MSEFVSCNENLDDGKIISSNLEQSIFYGNIDEKSLLYFTGCSFQKFSYLLDGLINFKPSLSIKLGIFPSFADQLIMTLSKFKHNYDWIFYRVMYGSSVINIENIFQTVTTLLHDYFKSSDFWLARKSEKGNYTVLFFILPMKLSKFLIALDSKSNVIFCSNLYLNTTNREIILDTKVSVDSINNHLQKIHFNII